MSSTAGPDQEPHRFEWRKEVWWVGALVLVASAALGIRLFGIGAEPFWIDEACTGDYNRGTLSGIVRRYAGDIHPPLYGVVVHVWGSCAGASEVALRSYSVALSVVGLVFAALLARDVTGNRWAAPAAGLMLAVNPLDIWYARDARMYGQAACLLTVALWVLWRWLRREDGVATPWRLPVAYVLLAALVLYTHYVASVALASQVLAGVVLFSSRRRWRDVARLLGAAAAAVASFVPWVLYVHHIRPSLYSAGHVGWMQKPNLGEVLGYVSHEFFLGLAGPAGNAAGWFTVVAGGLLAAAVVAAASAGPAPAGAPPRRAREAIALLLWLALGPALVAAAISNLWVPVYFRLRFSLFCLAPAVVALVAMLAKVRPPLRTALFAAIAAFMATGAAWQAASPTKQGLRELRHLAASFGEPEFVLLLPHPNLTMLHYYLPHARQQPSQEEVTERLRTGTPAIVWVGFEDGTLPPAGSPEGTLVSWLATTGPHRVLGRADDFKVYELRATSVPASGAKKAE